MSFNVSVKENVFQPFLSKHGDVRRVGGGRDVLMEQTLKNFSSLLTRCPELETLCGRIQDAVST